MLSALQMARLSTRRSDARPHDTCRRVGPPLPRSCPVCAGSTTDEYEKVNDAFEGYQRHDPEDEEVPRESPTTSRTSSAGPGAGSAAPGLPTYNVLIEGFNQALDNDIVLSMKQGNVAAPSRVVDDREVHDYFKHHGHRTAVSQRALQAHADPLLGYTEIDGNGYVVSGTVAVRGRPGLERADRTRRTHGGDRAARAGRREGALRRRRRQRSESRRASRPRRRSSR